MDSGRPQRWFSNPRAPQVIVAGFTAFFLVVGLWSLGVGAFPSNGWKADGEAVLDLGSAQRVDHILLAALDFGPIRAKVACGEPGSWSSEVTLSASLRYKQWYPKDIFCETRYIRLNFTRPQITVAEVVPFQGQKVVPVASVIGPPGSEKLLDEEHLITEPLSYRNSAYFDEPLFVGTADKYLQRAPPFFEWTHPPLGKDLITLSILTAGNGPFGWRLLGVLAGAVAIPAAYLLGRNLLGNRRAGVLTAALITFDFMHFTQARIATGEIFLFLFLTAMWAFFAAWWTTPCEKLSQKNVAIWRNPLFIAVVFFGLALSVKIIAVNSLAALLLLALLRVRKERDLFRASVRPFAAGLAVAGVIYLATYAPYYASGLGISDVLAEQCCGPRSMFGFHSAFSEVQPYGSPWWSWPLMLHPLLMKFTYIGDKISTVVSMGNPVLWWSGLVFIALAFRRVWKGRAWPERQDGIARGRAHQVSLARQNRIALFIAVAWLVQWVSFAPISRVLFLYHYFPNVALLALGCAWGVEWMWEKNPRRGLYLAVGLVSGAAVLFGIFYPVISGTPVDVAYKNSLQWIRLGFPLWWGPYNGQPAGWYF